jgi:hypothetical protein
MVAGVFGTVIAAERAVALRTNFPSQLAYGAFISPLLNVTGSILLVAGTEQGEILLVLGSLGMVAIYGIIIRRQPTIFTAVMGIGACMLLVGNVLWATDQPIYKMVYWWMGFLILTIVGERLELARVMRPSALRQPTFLAAILLFTAGVALTIVERDAGARLMGAGAVTLAIWLFRYDIARFTIRQNGLPRFIAACLLTGYGWLATGGFLSIVYGAEFGGFRYDAVLHAILLGFVFSMIFGHAPIIIPALMKLPVPFHRRYYIHFAVLHVGLIARVGSDIAGSWSAREWSGLINVIAVLVFLVNTLYAIRSGSTKAAQVHSTQIGARPANYRKV